MTRYEDDLTTRRRENAEPEQPVGYQLWRNVQKGDVILMDEGWRRVVWAHAIDEDVRPDDNGQRRVYLDLATDYPGEPETVWNYEYAKATLLG